MSFTVKLPPPDGGAKIISLEVVRESRLGRRIDKTCAHDNCRLDASLTVLSCKDCGKELSPIEWIIMMTEEWAYVQHLFKSYKEAEARYEGKKRCRCEHCGKLTGVKPMSAAEVRKLRESPRQDEPRTL